MAIDNCKYSFYELSNDVLPQYMESLDNAPFFNVCDFCKPNVGPGSIAKQMNLKNEQGLYVLYDGLKPIYVGISRKMVSRIRQHVTGKAHNDASLVFKMANKAMKMDGRRNELMKNVQFANCFEKMKEFVKSLKVRFVPVDNEVELYLLEVYVAMKLDTSEWNTFRTH